MKPHLFPAQKVYRRRADSADRMLQSSPAIWSCALQLMRPHKVDEDDYYDTAAWPPSLSREWQLSRLVLYYFPSLLGAQL